MKLETKAAKISVKERKKYLSPRCREGRSVQWCWNDIFLMANPLNLPSHWFL